MSGVGGTSGDHRLSTHSGSPRRPLPARFRVRRMGTLPTAESFRDEYIEIRGEAFERPDTEAPYVGRVNPHTLP